MDRIGDWAFGIFITTAIAAAVLKLIDLGTQEITYGTEYKVESLEATNPDTYVLSIKDINYRVDSWPNWFIPKERSITIAVPSDTEVKIGDILTFNTVIK